MPTRESRGKAGTGLRSPFRTSGGRSSPPPRFSDPLPAAAPVRARTERAERTSISGCARTAIYNAVRTQFKLCLDCGFGDLPGSVTFLFRTFFIKLFVEPSAQTTTRPRATRMHVGGGRANTRIRESFRTKRHYQSSLRARPSRRRSRRPRPAQGPRDGRLLPPHGGGALPRSLVAPAQPPVRETACGVRWWGHPQNRAK